MKTLEVSLEEYTAFHGMLCNPFAVQRAIQTFRGGAIVFADQKEYDAAAKGKINLEDYDCNIVPIPLSMWSYYLLVLISLTGFCSALGFTRVIEVVDYSDNSGDEDTQLRFKKGDGAHIESSNSEPALPLIFPSSAIDYVIDQSFKMGPLSTKSTTNGEFNANSTTLKHAVPEVNLVRKFEYDFGGFISVMMLHFLCTNGKTHLMEIYRVNTESTPGLVAKKLLDLLNRLKLSLMKLDEKKQPVKILKKTD